MTGSRVDNIRSTPKTQSYINWVIVSGSAAILFININVVRVWLMTQTWNLSQMLVVAKLITF